MYNLKQSRSNAHHKPILLQLRVCTKRNGSYGKLQYSIMYWGILKKMDYTGPDLKKNPHDQCPLRSHELSNSRIVQMSLDYNIVIYPL